MNHQSENSAAVVVDNTGSWTGVQAVDHHAFDHQLANAVSKFFLKEKATSVLDMGCGPGWYVNYMRLFKIKADGVDGNPFTPQLSNGVATVADLSKPLQLGVFDWVLSLEVGEHLPAQFEDVFIENLHTHNLKGIVLSWAVPGQGGLGHFNERPNHYIVSQLHKKGYVFDKKASTRLRACSSLSWFANTVMVFRRKALNCVLKKWLINTPAKNNCTASKLDVSRTVWTYWEGDQPDIVQQCLATWKRFLPDWDIRVLNEKSALELDLPKPQKYSQLTTTARSDSLRIALLWKFGGLWMDASIMLLDNLNWLKQYEHLPAFWFTLRNRQHAENWLIYAPRAGSELFKKWLFTLNNVLDTSPFSAHHVFERPYVTDVNYFMAYQAFFYLRNSVPAFGAQVDQVPLVDAEPFFYDMMKPLDKHFRLIKFTKEHRNQYNLL